MTSQDRTNIIKQVVAVVIITLFFTLSCNNNPKHNAQKVLNGINTEEIDSHFLVKAADINLAEIKYGQLAQQIGMNNDIIKLGKILEAEHLKSYAELALLANNKKIVIPIFASESAQNIFKQMSEKAGNNFDIIYSDLTIKNHETAIEIYKTAYHDTNDDALKAWIKLSLMSFENHLKMILLYKSNQKKIN